MNVFTRVATSTIALAATAIAANAQDIKVGVLLPYSGTYASLGGEIEAGFLLGLEVFGAEGMNFEIVKEDTEAKPPVGLAKTRKLVMQDKVDVIMGVVSSGVMGAVRDMIDGSKVPLIVTTAGNDDATGENCSAYVTRLAFSNRQINRPMGAWMAEQGIKKVYTLAPDYAAGHQMIAAFTEGFQSGGGEVVGGAFSAFQKTQDFGTYLAEAKESGADAIYAFYAGGEAISFVKQYDSFGLSDTLPLFGMGLLTSPLYVAAQGEAALGTIVGLNYVPTIDNPENKAFVDAYAEAYGKGPSEFSVYGYDAAKALVNAVEGGASDRESLAVALAKASFQGPRGETRIDPATNNIIQPIYVFETVEGEGGALTQKVLAELPVEQDPPNGCTLSQ
jgi:branched-chain amino acid transport system substrate-binding protein